jgi:sigma-E factor negative regulatory protein RseA
MESDMSSEAKEVSMDAERLSALVDGELDLSATEMACARWKGDAQARCTWHAYQLIGDVLRSEDLASPAGADERFLLSVRARLAAEPVVLAPAPLVSLNVLARTAAGRGRGSRWVLPSAVAAGVLLVMGTFSALRPGNLPAAGAPAVALSDASAPVAVESSLRSMAVAEPVEPVAVVMNGKVIRDARLERYLAAHKQFSGSSALGVPSAFLRSATVETEGR